MGRDVRSDAREKVTTNALPRYPRTNIDSSARPTSSSGWTPAEIEASKRRQKTHMTDRTGHGGPADRSRSRSPYRHPQTADSQKSRSASISPGRDARREKRRRQDDHYTTSSSDQRRHNGLDDQPYTHADRERSRSPYKAPTNGHRRPLSSHSDKHVETEESGESRGRTTERKSRDAPPSSSDATPSENAGEQKQLSEAEIIEERRKKREAIRKKYAAASANDSLLRAALESNLPSTGTTSQNGSSGQVSAPQSPPSSVNSPRTPRDDLTPLSPRSPAEIAPIKDEDLVNPVQLDAAHDDDQGQSAADYDPNQDMNEDRPDHKRQDLEQNGDMADVNESSAATHKPKDEFDMFADDDDDDMFAPTDKAPAASGPTKVGRALDESLQDDWDFPDGHYRIINGELLDGRYSVTQQIGKGTFATVVRARDSQTGNSVAIKIACRNDTMLKAGQKEMEFLQRLNGSDPDDKKYIIRLLSDFTHKGHLCLVFEGLEMDLRETLKKFGRDVGINAEAIQIYARQIFHALLHLKHSEVLHADLKPDNVLVSSDNKFIKICDFGTATMNQDAEVTPYLVSRFYRAPEVILGMDFDYAIDMWSIGCTLYELYTGRILFNGSDNNNMLRVIQECRGKLPNRLIKRAKLADKYFDEAFTFYGLERDKMTGNLVQRPMHFSSQGAPGRDLKSKLSANTKKMDATHLKLHSTFIDLLDKCLQLDPDKRITPRDALRHPFVNDMARENLAPSKAKSTTHATAKAFRPTPNASRAG